MAKNRQMCVICAWRENCKKKFSYKDGQLNCPDFSEDLKIKKEIEKQNEKQNR